MKCAIERWDHESSSKYSEHFCSMKIKQNTIIRILLEASFCQAWMQVTGASTHDARQIGGSTKDSSILAGTTFSQAVNDQVW